MTPRCISDGISECRARRISEADAHQLMKQVERFYEWVRSKVGQ